jgi:hypothetical protein
MANNLSYQSSHGNSNDQVMYTTSNRSRSESGSSDSSRGSGNSGKQRRRSHRPRGCRGGSNRRRQKNGEPGNKQFFKKTYNSDFKNRVHGKFSKSSVNQNNHAGPSEEEYVTNNMNKNSGQDSFSRGSYNNNSGKDYNNGFLPDYPYPKSGISVATASDLQQGGNTYGHNLQVYYGNNAPKYIGEPENDYPLLQSSYSESSSETIFEQRDAYTQNNHDDGILPPPPSDESFHRPNHQILPGPNPYALKSSGFAGCINNSNPVYVTHSYAAPTPAPAIVHPVSRPPRPHHMNSTPNMTPYLPGILQQQEHNNQVDYNYRAQRLEKQRQNVVGGSLFVTSPRSFLMSCKRSFHE